MDQIERAEWGEFGVQGPTDPRPFELPIANYYMTDPISRASETMAECTRSYVTGEEKATGTHG